MNPPEPDHSSSQINELMGGLAHEIRNPLSTFQVNLKLLAEELDETSEDDLAPQVKERALQRLQTLQSETERLQELLDKFLKLIGHQELNTQLVDLNVTIQQLAEFFTPVANQRGIRVEMELQNEPLMCRVDPNVLKQALLNILLNACEAMSAQDRLIISSGTHDRLAQIVIADTGPGIEPHVLDRIFLPFFSTKREGTGLGLPVTRRIIEEHSGTIEVQSKPQEGTRFIVRLPLSN